MSPGRGAPWARSTARLRPGGREIHAEAWRSGVVRINHPAGHDLASSTPHGAKAVPSKGLRERIKGAGQIFKHLPATLALVWKADRAAGIAVPARTGVPAVRPAGSALGGD